ncbi:hypothetical protein ACFWXH_17165 [Mesorhizobium sp. NPDC059054]|uniref:hypothetical protein n=1 Tax=Mesorhizobium sp. NPDC059054 TaxID=3346711 RepID=UPI003675C0B1
MHFAAGAPAGQKKIEKIAKIFKRLLTPEEAIPYMPLTNDSGDAAGDEEVRFWVSRSWTNSREPRERHSTGLELRSGTGHDVASAMSVL